MTERLVVVGGDAGSMSAASQARRRLGREDLSIIAFERGPYTSFSACGIPYFVGGVVRPFQSLIARTPEQFRSAYDIDARTGHEVLDIDLDRRSVHVRSDAGQAWEGFDYLVIGTGAVPVRLDLPGADARGIFGVQTLPDGLAVDRYIGEFAPQRAVVVGGGYIGLEMAEAFKQRGLSVALIERSEQPMGTLDPDMGALVADAMRALDIEVLTNEAVAGFETTGGRVAGVVTKERTLRAEIVAFGIGVRPNTDLASAAGLVVGESGAIAVDRRMRTAAEGVYSAGDCAEKWHRVARRPVAIALGTHANKEGRIAGINVSGGYATFPGVIGTAVSKICGAEVARTGLNESEAKRAGFDALGVTVDSTTRAGYFPGARPIKVKVVAERGSGALLGAQIVGEEGAAKRIDVLATAVWNEMSVDELINVDLSYAPPFSPLWDPVLAAARRAWQAVEQGR